MIRLSILIPTIVRHNELLIQLMGELQRQVTETCEVEILIDDREHVILGAKRNHLLQEAKGEYVQFIDADDTVVSDYLQTILPLLQQDPDCLSLRGMMTTNGENPELFEHSIKYNKWRTTARKIKYERYPNHLNVIRASIAKKFPFPEISFGEDYQWSTSLYMSGLLKREIYIDKLLYYYRYLPK